MISPYAAKFTAFSDKSASESARKTQWVTSLFDLTFAEPIH